MSDKNFKTSLKLGDLGQEIVEALMKKQGLNFRRTEHTEYTEKGLNFEADYYLKDEKTFVEVKYLSGEDRYGVRYDTLCIEKFKNKDLSETKTAPIYPGWIKTCKAGKKLKLYIFNKRDMAVYIYDANKMYDAIMNYDERLSTANDGNIHNSGFIVKFPWRCEEAGFLTMCKLTRFRGINLDKEGLE